MDRRTMLMGGLGMLAAGAAGAAEKQPSGRGLFAPENLVAWCIVPFDAKHRGPEERAAMMQRLGIRRFAYDWRDEHLPTLDRELDALRKHGVSLDAFWFPTSLEPEKQAHVTTILDFLARRSVKTQLWLSLGLPDRGSQEERIARAAHPVGWVADAAGKIGCSVGLYNHGGWFGEPENQVQVIRAVGRKNVGIAYNFHHAHHRIEDWPAAFAVMKPHLLTLNINGMRKDGPKILGVGKGDRELEMLRVVARSDYRGPIGILGHRAELDAEVALRENLDGLRGLAPRLQ